MYPQACEAQRKLAGNMSPIAFNARARLCPFSERAEEKADARKGRAEFCSRQVYD